MAERVVSPGVFTNEIDQSFLPAAISNLGAALIGTCNKGPAFVPTKVDSYSDFTLKFGGLTTGVENQLKQASTDELEQLTVNLLSAKNAEDWISSLKPV